MTYQLTEGQRQIYRRYASLALPRHTSYPSAPAWNPDYGPLQFRTDLRDSLEQGREFSLYIHIPFCERLCYYCACTKEIVPPAKHRHNDPGETLLRGLNCEAQRLAGVLDSFDRLTRSTRPVIRQVHLGGGSPTFLNSSQLDQLWKIVAGHFRVVPDAELAIEVDPRITSLEQLQTLRGLGFNRISLGIQDFTPAVQRAVNRAQSVELVARLMSWCRSLGFESVNFDLIYGLPFQTLDSMADTLDKTVNLSPDRIAFYRLAVIPEIFRWQNVFEASDLPSSDLTLDLNLLAINRFLEAGYEFIGLDHFAKPDEALARASRDGSLHRTFQGMTTGKGLGVLGLGPSAITQLDSAFAQNVKTSAEWSDRVSTAIIVGEVWRPAPSAIDRGLHLTHDDRLRRELLQQLYGYGVIDKCALEQKFNIRFDEYFEDENRRLRELVEQDIVHTEEGKIVLTTPLGRLLVRVVASVFDSYLPSNAYQNGLASHQAARVG